MGRTLRERWRESPADNYRAFFDGARTIRFAIDPSRPIAPLRRPEIEDVSLGTKCLAACSFCLLPGTPVLLGDGSSLPIEALGAGERVVACREGDLQFESHEATQKYERHYEGEVIEIEIAGGAKLVCTPNHRVMTRSGWKKAEDLTVEDEVLTAMHTD